MNGRTGDHELLKVSNLVVRHPCKAHTTFNIGSSALQASVLPDTLVYGLPSDNLFNSTV